MKRRSIAVLVVLMTAGCGDPPPGPGVVLGAGVVDKTLFLDEPALGDVRSISLGQFTADGSAPIVVAGRAGAAFLNSTGEVRHLVRFDGLLINPVPVDVNGDGEYEFMDRGGGWQPVSLVDSQGQVIWRFEGEGFAAPNGMAAADLDGDGLLDFVVGLNGGEGVVRLAHQGRTVWTVDATNAFSVAIFEDDRGEPAVVHSDARSIMVRDASGA